MSWTTIGMVLLTAASGVFLGWELHRYMRPEQAPITVTRNVPNTCLCSCAIAPQPPPIVLCEGYFTLSLPRR